MEFRSFSSGEKFHLAVYLALALEFPYPLLQFMYDLDREVVLVSSGVMHRENKFAEKWKIVDSISFDGHRMLFMYFDSTIASDVFDLNHFVRQHVFEYPPKTDLSPPSIYLHYLGDLSFADFYLFYDKIYCLYKRRSGEAHFSLVETDDPKGDWAILKERELVG